MERMSQTDHNELDEAQDEPVDDVDISRVRLDWGVVR